MSKLLCNVLKISWGANAPNAPPGCTPAENPNDDHSHSKNSLLDLVHHTDGAVFFSLYQFIFTFFKSFQTFGVKCVV